MKKEFQLENEILSKSRELEKSEKIISNETMHKILINTKNSYTKKKFKEEEEVQDLSRKLAFEKLSNKLDTVAVYVKNFLNQYIEIEKLSIKELGILETDINYLLNLIKVLKDNKLTSSDFFIEKTTISIIFNPTFN